MRKASLILVLILAACGDDDDFPDARPRIDAAPGTIDAAIFDGPTPIDGAPSFDAVIFDGPVVTFDAPTFDATVFDVAPPHDYDIREIQQGRQDGSLAEGTVVFIGGAVVTARIDVGSPTPTSTTLFVQEPTGLAPYSGIMVFVDRTPEVAYPMPAVGDLVSLNGTVSEFNRGVLTGTRTNIDPVTDITILGTATVPAPVVVPEAELLFTDEAGTAEQWEGVLVQVNAPVVKTRDGFGEFTLTGDLKVAPRLFAYPQPYPDDKYDSIAGPLDHDFDTNRILPRNLGDLVNYQPAQPKLASLTPASIAVPRGTTGMLLITLDRPAPTGGIDVDLTSSDPTIATVPTPVNVPATMSSFPVTVTADATNAGPVTVQAMWDGVPKSAIVNVVASLYVTPDPATIMTGGTGILRVNLLAPAPVGGTPITISSSDPAVVTPPTLTIPAGATSATFRIKHGTGAGTAATLTVSDGTGTYLATVNVTTTATAPDAAGQILINEINYDVPSTAPNNAFGDANCNGTVEVGGASAVSYDEFVEMVNTTGLPLAMGGVHVWDSTATLRFAFPSTFVLGPGEVAVVFGGMLGTDMTQPWCTNLDGSHIGDAAAFAGTDLGLTNAGDSVVISWSANRTDVLDMRAFTSGNDDSVNRSPDVIGTGAFVRYTLAPGHLTDRRVSPGTRIDGQRFADALPP